MDHSHNENIDLARDILIWILLAARPLTLSELNMVLAMRLPETNETSGLLLESRLFKNVVYVVLYFFAPFIEIIIRKSRDDPSSNVRVSIVKAL